MTGHTFSAALTFALLAGGAAAIGSEMFSPRRTAAPQATMQAVTLPTVIVTGQRQKPVEVAAGTPAEPARGLTSDERRAGSCG